MNQTKSSSSDFTMAAATSQTFHHLLDQIQNSNLNFHLQQSPFSAIISLKKSPIKDASGMYLMPTIPSSFSEASLSKTEAIFLEQKLDELEEANKNLKDLYNDAMKDNESNRQTISRLESQLQSVKNSDKHENLKKEIKSVNAKFEKARHDLLELKNENDGLKRYLNTTSINLKAAKKDLKDLEKVKNIEIKGFQKELRSLKEFKEKYDKEQSELRKKQKKENKQRKKVAEREAKDKLEKKSLEESSVSEATASASLIFSVESCHHIPQCILRSPSSPPLGPRTFLEYQLDCEIAKQEALEEFIDYVKGFIKQEDGETLDDQLEKLEALKNLLEPEKADDTVIDELIEKIKTLKLALGNLHKDDDETAWSEYDDDDDDLPPHYWGGDDGNEIIFYECDE